MTSGMDDTVEGLQETTDKIVKYCGLGGLKINAKKTEIMGFFCDSVNATSSAGCRWIALVVAG